MTQAEWMDAFRRGDPENIGRAVLAAIQQAYAEQSATGNRYEVSDIGELAPMKDGSDRPNYVMQLCVRAGQLLCEHGLTVVGEEDSRDQH